jgi:cytochrome c5
VSAEHDRKFFDTFMLILGILFAVTLGLIGVARMIASNTSIPNQGEDPLNQAQVAGRIEPIAHVAVAGKDNAALTPPPAAAAPAAAAADLPGDQVFNQVCTACHAAGIAGAPKAGDKAAWAPRLAQGMDLLHKHAIDGFQGKAGFMPPKGGRADLSDQSIKNAVDYLVGLAK